MRNRLLVRLQLLHIAPLTLCGALSFQATVLAAQEAGGGGGDGDASWVEASCASSDSRGHTQVGGLVLDQLTTGPLTERIVSVRENGGSGEQLAVTDDYGRFLLCDLPWVGGGRVEFEGPDGELLKRAIHVVAGSNWVGTAFFRATPPAVLTGRVTERDSRTPLQGARVELAPLGLSTLTGPDGRFEMTGFAGALTVSVEHPSYDPVRERVWLNGAFRFDADIRLAQASGSSSVEIEGGPGRGVEREVARMDPAEQRQATGGGAPIAPRHPALEPGQRARLTAPGLIVREAVVEGTDGTTLSLREEQQNWTLPLDVVEDLQVRKTQSLRLGAVVGALGFAAGAWLGAKVILEKECEIGVFGGVLGELCQTHPVGAMRVGVPAGLVGAGVGLALGRVVLRWSPVF